MLAFSVVAYGPVILSILYSIGKILQNRAITSRSRWGYIVINGVGFLWCSFHIAIGCFLINKQGAGFVVLFSVLFVTIIVCTAILEKRYKAQSVT